LSTPVDCIYTHKGDDETESNGRYPIREAIGALTYLANVARPDIAVAVNNVARNVQKPTEKLWRATQRIIKYLATTRDLGLRFEPNGYLVVKDSRTPTSLETPQIASLPPVGCSN
jgi:hypothetical protein